MDGRQVGWGYGIPVQQTLLLGHAPHAPASTPPPEKHAHEVPQHSLATLIMHGDDDQIVPIGAAALRSSKIVQGSTLKVYPGLPHGMCSTHKDQINADLLAFLER
jgi:pimeloyl-ACP methyl ester carboxylesterase